jgi:hypothetical protein
MPSGGIKISAREANLKRISYSFGIYMAWFYLEFEKKTNFAGNLNSSRSYLITAELGHFLSSTVGMQQKKIRKKSNNLQVEKVGETLFTYLFDFFLRQQQGSEKFHEYTSRAAVLTALQYKPQ